ncbi:MAG: hypothetical protein LBF43_02535 [Puniceicoccales bacterium]|nr:hypothetical protein [Puniceicoccales bacterium]
MRFDYIIFLTPFVHADVDFGALANEIIQFVNQLDLSNQRVAERLQTQASSLPKGNLTQRRKAIQDILRVLPTLATDPDPAGTLATLIAEVKEASINSPKHPLLRLLKQPPSHILPIYIQGL